MFIRMCFVVVNYVRKVPSLVVITGKLSHQVGGRLCPPVTWVLVFFCVLVQHAQGHFQALHVGIEATICPSGLVSVEGKRGSWLSHRYYMSNPWAIGDKQVILPHCAAWGTQKWAQSQIPQTQTLWKGDILRNGWRHQQRQ